VSRKLNLFLVEDSAILRARLGELIEEKLPDINVVGFAEDELSAKMQLALRPVDVVVVDLELKSGSGVGVLQAIQKNPAQFNNVLAVVLTTHSNPKVLEYCRKLGARACFDKADQMDAWLEYMGAIQARMH